MVMSVTFAQRDSGAARCNRKPSNTPECSMANRGCCVLFFATILLVLSPGVGSMRPCFISPAAGCHCRDTERPQVICSALSLKTLPRLYSNMSDIHTLQFSYNSIKSVESYTFVGLSRLKRLILGHNKLSKVVDLAFFKLEPTLRWLDLSYNRLPGVPYAVWRLWKLHVLDLRNNQIETISGGIMSGLSELRQLYLQDNPISILFSGAFSGLQSLNSLSISIPSQSFQLKDFPTRNIRQLEEFWLTNTGLNLTSSKKFFGSLPHLKSLGLINCGLSVRDNQLKHLPTRKIKNLKHLSLANNSLLLITHYSTTARRIKDLKQLETLDLSGNKMRSLNKGMRHVFKRLLSLKSLILNDNHISTFHTSIISDLKNLTLMDLRNNNLNTLYSWDRLDQDQISKIHLALGGNPWRCDCELKWLKILVEKQIRATGNTLDNSEVFNTLACTKPSMLKGLLIKDIGLEGTTCYHPKPKKLDKVCEKYINPFCLKVI